MKENLKTTKYRDGSAITYIADNTAWFTQTAGAYGWYNEIISKKDTYGLLYNWYAVVDSRDLCPSGWHVPTDTEWTTLTDYLGGASFSGGKLKATTLWESPNTGANNSSGFTALPGGLRAEYGNYSNMGCNGYWWSGSEFNSSLAWLRELWFDQSDIQRGGINKYYGFSVRCLKN